MISNLARELPDKKKEQAKIIRKRILKYFFIILIPLLAVIAAGSWKEYQTQLTVEKHITETDEARNLLVMNRLLISKLAPVIADLDYLSHLSLLERAVSSGFTDSSLEKVSRLFISFSRRKGIYDQVRLLDNSGMEILRVNYSNGKAELVPREELQLKAGRYYYKAALQLHESEIFISPMDLNIENGKIERPFKPMIRLATPLFVIDRLSGVLILNYLAEELINLLHDEHAYYLGDFMLLNQEGYWFHSHNREDEWGFMFPDRLTGSFKTGYPEEWQLIKKSEKGQFWRGNRLISYQTVYPLKGRSYSYVSLSGTVEHNDGINSQKGYYWKLVSIVPLSLVESRLQGFRARLRLSSIVLSLLAALAALIIAFNRAKRILAEEELVERAAIFDNNPAPVMRTRSSGIVINFNRAAEDILGLDPYKRSIFKLFSSIDESILLELTPQNPLKIVERINDHDYLINIKREPLDKSLLFYATDISELKKATNQLRQLSEIVRQSANAIALLDLEGRVEYVNKAFEDSTGYSLEELSGKTLRILDSGKEPEEVYEEILRVMRAGRVWKGEFLNKRKDATLYWARVSISPIMDIEGRITNYLDLQEDITTIKMSEEALSKAKEEADLARKQAEEANKMKSEFLANMSHEIRTPMNAVIGFTEILLLEEEDPEKIEKMEIIKSSGRNLLNLINDILDFSRIEADKLAIESSNFNLRELLQQTESLFLVEAEKKGLSFSLQIADPLPEVVSADSHRITQILTNLLSNAFKFTKHDGIELKCEYRDGQAVIKIKDTGIGIEDKKVELIFSAFTQADSSTAREYGGTGLGLAISRRLAELMGGTLEVVSEVGVGSTFTLTIPLKLKDTINLRSHDESVSEETAPQPSKGSIPSDYKILTAEDDQINQQLIEALLEKSNLKSDFAANGRIALDKLGAGAYDLLLLDMQMPVLDGEETIKRIRSDLRIKDLYVIALTAHALKGDKEKYLNLGCNDYLSKPIDTALFKEKIMNAVSHKHKHQSDN